MKRIKNSQSTHLTSVKILPHLMEGETGFNEISKQNWNISIQKLLNRSIYCFNTDVNFRNKIMDTICLMTSGSGF